MKKRNIDRRKSKRNRFIPKPEFRYFGDEIYVFAGKKCCLIIYP